MFVRREKSLVTSRSASTADSPPRQKSKKDSTVKKGISQYCSQTFPNTMVREIVLCRIAPLSPGMFRVSRGYIQIVLRSFLNCSQLNGFTCLNFPSTHTSPPVKKLRAASTPLINKSFFSFSSMPKFSQLYSDASI